MSPTVNSEQESVLVESSGAIRILTLNRPEKLNAADLEMQQRVPQCVQAIQEEDDEARALVLTGAGRGFSAGADLSVVRRNYATGEEALREELNRIYNETVTSLLSLPIPVIAAVHGPAIGWGATLVALSDVVVMSEEAFLSEPHVKYGLGCDPICQMIWPRLTSQTTAKELLMSGRQVSAAEALRLGLANQVRPTGQDVSTALEIAQSFLEMPKSGVAGVKRSFNQPLLEEFESIHRRARSLESR